MNGQAALFTGLKDKLPGGPAIRWIAYRLKNLDVSCNKNKSRTQQLQEYNQWGTTRWGEYRWR